jgi:hypothetical protein
VRDARAVIDGIIRTGKVRKKNDYDNNSTVPSVDVLNKWGE